MKEAQAREMMDELFKRHSVPSIPIEFHPNVMTTQKETITTPLGGKITQTVKLYGLFRVKKMMDESECWIEFYGNPSAYTVRHEFRHYLDHLGLKYIRKRPDG